MKLSEKIKAAIQPNATAGYQSARTLISMNWPEILAAVEAMEEGRVLPRLPEGWYYKWTCEGSLYSEVRWTVAITDWSADDFFGHFELVGEGPTPAAAAEGAIRKVQEGK